MFFENFYIRKQNRIICFAVYALTFAFQYGMSFASFRSINLITFAISTFLIALICYESKIKTCVFTTLMLTFFMVITELIVIYSSTFLFKTDLVAYESNLLVLVIQTSLMKLLFFVGIFFISKYFKNRADKKAANKFTMLLSLLPLTSLAIFYTIFYWGIKTADTSPFNAALAICSILLLFVNIFVFFIWERVQKAHIEITQLQLEKQRREMSTEYYEHLSREYSNQRIFIHDIKNHFQSISDIAASGDCRKVCSYINALSENFGVNTNIKYSENKMFNAIINRYVNACKSKGIRIEIEACCSNLEFIAESDIVALFDNLLDNAIEATEKSDKKEISLSIYIRNQNFVVISVINSCDSKPKIKNGKLLTNKKNKSSHGIGTQSINRVVENYNGNYTWSYDESKKRFEAKVVFMTAGLKQAETV